MSFSADDGRGWATGPVQEGPKGQPHVNGSSGSRAARPLRDAGFCEPDRLHRVAERTRFAARVRGVDDRVEAQLLWLD
jgi:hypothetical protein